MKFILIFLASSTAGFGINFWDQPVAFTAEFADEQSCRNAAVVAEADYRRVIHQTQTVRGWVR